MKGMKQAMEMGKKMHEMYNDKDKEQKEADEEKAKEADKEKKKETDEEKKVEEANKRRSTEDRLVLLEKAHVQLSGKYSALLESTSARDTESYLDKKLKESKLARSVTKRFREHAGELKTKKQIDEKLNLFIEAHKVALKESNTDWQLDGKGFTETGGEADHSQSLDFTECAE